MNERTRCTAVLAALAMISAGWLASCGDDAPPVAVSPSLALPVSLELDSFVIGVDPASAADRAAHRAALSEVVAALPPEVPRPTDEALDECVDELAWKISVDTREPSGLGHQLLGEELPPENGLTLAGVVDVSEADGRAAVAVLRAGSEISQLEYEGETLEFVQDSTWVAAVIPVAAMGTANYVTLGVLPMTVDGVEQHLQQEWPC